MKYKIITVCIVIVAILSNVALAKYNTSYEKEMVYVAESFYFTSDLLNGNSNLTTYTYQKGKNSISVILKNNIDDYRFSDVDIEYTIRITDANGTEVKNSISGVLEKGNIDTETITFDNLETGIYTITATATAPYEQSIRANFVIETEDSDILYEVTDVENSAVVQLKINTNDYAGNVKITWPNGCTPDNTIEEFSNINTNFQTAFKIIQMQSKSERIIQFFKEDATTKYSKSDFIVERSN